MEKISIGNFVSAGLNSDLNPVDLGENFLTRVNNVRMKNGGITPFGGHVDVTSLPDNKVPRSMYFTESVDGSQWIIICDDDIYSYTSVFNSIKPADMATVSDTGKWQILSISGITIINSPSAGPYFKDGANDKFMPLPFKGTETWQTLKHKTAIMGVHKQFLFAMGPVDDGKDYPNAVRWSAPADIGAVPTTWDELDTTNVAGLTNLGGDAGSIVGGLSMRDAFVVYCQSGITIFDYVGGQYVWRVRNLEGDVGLLARNAVTDVNGRHYFLSIGDAYVTDGTNLKSIATDRVRTIINSIDKHNASNSFAVHNVKNKEVWFCFPTGGYEYATTALIYNYEYDSWLQRDLPNVISIGNGVISSEDSIWDNAHEKWDGSTKSWSDNATSPFDSVFLGLVKASDTSFKLSLLDFPVGFNSHGFSAIIERTDLALGGIDQVNTITRVYPHISGASKVRIQLGSQMIPGGPVLWKPYVEFTPNNDRKADIRTTGCLHCYRIMATDVESNFILTGLDFEYTKAGTR